MRLLRIAHRPHGMIGEKLVTQAGSCTEASLAAPGKQVPCAMEPLCFLISMTCPPT